MVSKMKGQFEGKVVLVTGGGSGIGRACAVAFAREMAKVIVATDMNVEGGKETVQMIKQDGGDAIFVKADVSKATEVEALINKAVETYGRLDCAFNNAGRGGRGVPMLDVTEEEWDRVININLKGVWLCMKYEIPQMLKQGGGAIVNTSSGAGVRPATNHYGASKWGVEGLTQGAAQLYAKDGIRVNVVRPGHIETGFTAALREQMSKSQPTAPPIGPGADPAIMAPAVLWLCSEAASHVTGASIPVGDPRRTMSHG